MSDDMSIGGGEPAAAPAPAPAPAGEPAPAAGSDPSVSLEQAPAPAPNPGAGLSSAPDLSDVPEWKQALGNAPTLENFKSPDDFIKSYDSAQDMIRRSVRIPSQEAGQEALDEFYAKLEQVPGVYRQPNPDDPEAVKAFNQRMGVPDTPDAYTFTNPEGFEPNIEGDAAYKAEAHRLGLTPKQANEMRAYLAGTVVDGGKRYQAAMSEQMGALSKEWGMARDQELKLAEDTGTAMSQKIPGLGEWLKAGAGKDPMVIRLMNQIGKMGGEVGATPPGGVVPAMTPADAKQAISDMRNNVSHPFNNEGDPAHDVAVKKMEELYKFAHPDM